MQEWRDLTDLRAKQQKLADARMQLKEVREKIAALKAKSETREEEEESSPGLKEGKEDERKSEDLELPLKSRFDEKVVFSTTVAGSQTRILSFAAYRRAYAPNKREWTVFSIVAAPTVLLPFAVWYLLSY